MTLSVYPSIGFVLVAYPALAHFNQDPGTSRIKQDDSQSSTPSPHVLSHDPGVYLRNAGVLGTNR